MLERLLIKVKSELSLDLFSINQLFFGGGIVVSISIHCSLWIEAWRTWISHIVPLLCCFDNHDPFSINAHTQRHKKLIGGDFTAVVSPFKIKWFSIDWSNIDTAPFNSIGPSNFRAPSALIGPFRHHTGPFGHSFRWRQCGGTSCAAYSSS